MKIQVHMKDPDTLFDAIQDAVKKSLVMETPDCEEREALEEIRMRRVQKIAAKWFKYSEYLSVEIDTDAETCTVLEQS